MELKTTEWELKKHFYDSINSESYKKDINTYIENIEVFVKKYKGKIASLDIVELKEFYEDCDVLNVELYKVLIFNSLSISLDSQNQTLQKESLRLDKIAVDLGEKLLFISEEFKLIGYDKLIEYSRTDIMRFFRNSIIKQAKELKYTLSENEEKIYMQFSSATDSELFEQLTSSFAFKFREQVLTQDEIRTKRSSEDRQERKEAFESLASVFLNEQNKIVLSNLYSLVCRGNVLDVELRKYDTVMSERNESEELSDSTVNTLLDCVEKNYYLYHKFLKKKASFLELEKLETYDIFSPFPSCTKEPIYTFEEGWKLYIDTIRQVDVKLADFSENMLVDGRISVYPKLGKTGGAYAQYYKTIPEFVLLNWTNDYSDITTLAHELGHAFHGNLSKIQTCSSYYTPLTLAETASIFNETLMFEKLLEITTDKTLKRKLIYDRLNDLFATIFRQVMYVKFEKKCHEAFLKNEPMSSDDFNELWYLESLKLYGPDVNLDKDLIKHGWSSISHIFNTPFYCYTYAFGNIISLNIYQGYKESTDKEKFLNQYHSFLSAGGSEAPEDLLRDKFGIEFNDNFYQLAFRHIEELISKLD